VAHLDQHRTLCRRYKSRRQPQFSRLRCCSSSTPEDLFSIRHSVIVAAALDSHRGNPALTLDAKSLYAIVTSRYLGLSFQW